MRDFIEARHGLKIRVKENKKMSRTSTWWVDKLVKCSQCFHQKFSPGRVFSKPVCMETSLGSQRTVQTTCSHEGPHPATWAQASWVLGSATSPSSWLLAPSFWEPSICHIFWVQDEWKMSRWFLWKIYFQFKDKIMYFIVIRGSWRLSNHQPV